jgi:hypothetical protein
VKHSKLNDFSTGCINLTCDRKGASHAVNFNTFSELLHPPFTTDRAGRVSFGHCEPRRIAQQEASMVLTNVIGYVAAGLVFATFCAKDMVPLRMLAIASNIGFISYGFLLGLWPIMLLHSGMLPINIVRLREAFAAPSESGLWYQAIAQPRRSLAVRRWLARWSERERLRRELAGMRSRDFGDLAVPPGLIEDEKRRWPWHGWSPEWSSIALSPKVGDGEEGA